jgi:putative Mg2+ transporter-C (MgtC) family protein
MAGPHLTWLELVFRLGSALVLGSIIGAERQWRQRTAGLRTYSLVSIGAALFVLLAPLTGVREESRIAAQVISGVGFLGAGVLMRTGLSVHGLNTAPTIWCSAAVGILAGSGLFAAASLGTSFVLIINIFLRPLADWVGRHSKKEPSEHAVQYSIQIICRGRQEGRVRTLLIQLLTVSPLALQEVESVVGQDEKNTVIKATLSTVERNDAQVEQITSRLSLERDVVGISWQALPSTNSE